MSFAAISTSVKPAKHGHACIIILMYYNMSDWLYISSTNFLSKLVQVIFMACLGKDPKIEENY